MRRSLCILTSLLALAVLTTGCGGSDDEAKASVTREIVMTDGAMRPNSLSFDVGTTVQFVFKNEGTHDHEAVFGDEELQDEHEAMMKRQPHMAMKKGKTFVEVHKGGTETFTYTFDKAGTVFIGCHMQPDHYAQGERITVNVT